jgi:voltage-gated potassium channel Kch
MWWAYTRAWAYIRVGLYTGGLIFGWAYIRVGLYSGGLIFGHLRYGLVIRDGPLDI